MRCSGLRRVLRGELDPEDYADTLPAKRDCCCDTETDGKIISLFSALQTPEEHSHWRDSLVNTMTAARNNHIGKGGFHNGRLEGLFSICRGLCLMQVCD